MDVVAPEFQPYVTDPEPLEVVTPIKPSEAIRLGRLKYPYAIRRHYYLGDAACTLGAMVAGYGGEAQAKEVIDKLPKYVRENIKNIPFLVDFGYRGISPEKVEELIIRSLWAMGY